MAKAPSRTPWLETAAALVGLVLILGALAIVLVEALQPRTPPDLTLRLAQTRLSVSGWIATVEVRNTGRQTAADVAVEGVLTSPGGAPQTASATLAYAPGGGTEQVALGFAADPRAGDLALTVRGWTRP